MSYNIWFNNFLQFERLESLIEHINNSNPDVICLQEVRPFIYEILKNKLINYQYSFPNKLNHNYGCVTFSKYPMKKCTRYAFKNSNMGRELILTKIDYPINNNDNNNIIVANTHFESEFKKNNVKKKDQIKETFDILNKLYDTHHNVIFCADTNIIKHDEEYWNSVWFNNSSEWLDAYITLHNNSYNNSCKNNFTYDGKLNPYIKSKNRNRFDRILLRTDICNLIEFEMIGNYIDKQVDNYDDNRVNSKITPSDHFGISIKIEIKYKE